MTRYEIALCKPTPIEIAVEAFAQEPPALTDPAAFMKYANKQIFIATADRKTLDALAGLVGLTRGQDEPNDALRARILSYL